jgi:hypothetical protein
MPVMVEPAINRICPQCGRQRKYVAAHVDGSFELCPFCEDCQRNDVLKTLAAQVKSQILQLRPRPHPPGSL